MLRGNEGVGIKTKMKKIFFSLFAYGFSLFTCLFSQGLWTKKADFGGKPRWGAAAFSIGNKGYLGAGGDSVNYLHDFWEYDPSSDVWTQKTNFPAYYASEEPIGFSIGNYGYIVCSYSNELWRYDPVGNLWTPAASLLGPVRVWESAFSVGGYGYVGTGQNNTGYLLDFWKYDPVNDAWTQMGNFPGAGRNHICYATFVIGNKGYWGTGAGIPPGFYNDWWEYEPSTDIWTQKASLLVSQQRFGATAFSIGNKGYLGLGFGGSPNGTFLNDLLMYDPTANSWSSETSFPGIARYDAPSFVVNNKAYVGTGANSNGLCFTDFWEFAPKVTGINEIQGPISIAVSSNPFSTQTTFSFTEAIKNANFQLFSIAGKEERNISFSGRQLVVERGVLSAGIYFYFITTPSPAGEGRGEVATGKIIIQ